MLNYEKCFEFESAEIISSGHVTYKKAKFFIHKIKLAKISQTCVMSLRQTDFFQNELDFLNV